MDAVLVPVTASARDAEANVEACSTVTIRPSGLGRVAAVRRWLADVASRSPSGHSRAFASLRRECFDYVIVNKRHARRILRSYLQYLRFFWHGAEAPGNTYCYRIAGERLLIEHDGRSAGNHIHAIWRDAANDFGE